MRSLPILTRSQPTNAMERHATPSKLGFTAHPQTMAEGKGSATRLASCATASAAAKPIAANIAASRVAHPRQQTYLRMSRRQNRPPAERGLSIGPNSKNVFGPTLTHAAFARPSPGGASLAESSHNTKALAPNVVLIVGAMSATGNDSILFQYLLMN